MHWQVPAAYDDGAMLLQATEDQRLEGIVSKKRSSLYHPGRRSPDWLKFPHRAIGSYVVGGWRHETDSTSRIGAVLVGEPTEAGLVYRGRVGSGIAGKQGQRLLEVLGPLLAEGSPFADAVPAVDAAGTVWVRPEVVVDVAALGMTPAEAAAPAGLPRRPHRPHPRGPGGPAMAEQQTDEVLVDVDGRTLRISNLGKVMYPTTGTTKGEVLNYYARVSGVLLPHLAHRAVTRIRWPHGTGDMQFFEKNLPSGAPKWLHSVTVPSTGSRGGGDTISYPVIDGLADLTYFANLASLELHVHQWTVGSDGQPKNPDRLVIDLDPGHPAGLRECCEVALLVRDKLPSGACPRRR